MAEENQSIRPLQIELEKEPRTGKRQAMAFSPPLTRFCGPETEIILAQGH